MACKCDDTAKTSGISKRATAGPMTLMESVWQDWQTLTGNVGVYPAFTPSHIRQPYWGWLDRAGLDSLTLTANIRHLLGGASGAKLLLATGSTPSYPHAFIGDLTALVLNAATGSGGVPGSTTLRISSNPGSVMVSTDSFTDIYPTALNRYLFWVVVPPASGDWALTFQLLVTPKGLTGKGLSSGADRMITRDIQPWTSIKARGRNISLPTVPPRPITQPTSGWLDTRKLKSLGLTLDVLRLVGGQLDIRVAYTPEQEIWTKALTIPALTTLEPRFIDLLLTRDTSAGVTTLQNFLRWEIFQTGGDADTAIEACFRITGGGSQ